MKKPYFSRDYLLNAILVLNIVALVVVHWWYHDLVTLEWFLRSVLAIHLVLRWPLWFYHRNGWKH